jgi:hypothetical protein
MVLQEINTNIPSVVGLSDSRWRPREAKRVKCHDQKAGAILSRADASIDLALSNRSKTMERRAAILPSLPVKAKKQEIAHKSNGSILSTGKSYSKIPWASDVSLDRKKVNLKTSNYNFLLSDKY